MKKQKKEMKELDKTQLRNIVLNSKKLLETESNSMSTSELTRSNFNF